MVGFKDKLLFSNNKREMTKDLEFFNRNKVRSITTHNRLPVLIRCD